VDSVSLSDNASAFSQNSAYKKYRGQNRAMLRLIGVSGALALQAAFIFSLTTASNVSPDTANARATMWTYLPTSPTSPPSASPLPFISSQTFLRAIPLTRYIPEIYLHRSPRNPCGAGSVAKRIYEEDPCKDEDTSKSGDGKEAPELTIPDFFGNSLLRPSRGADESKALERSFDELKNKFAPPSDDTRDRTFDRIPLVPHEGWQKIENWNAENLK
jgi:hypothetical protein